MNSITAVQLKELINDSDADEIIIVDVREDWELQECKLDNSLHIPMIEIQNQLRQLEFNLPIIVYCHHGLRSLQVVNFLTQKGYIHVLNLEGGIAAWQRDVDPEMNTY